MIIDMESGNYIRNSGSFGEEISSLDVKWNREIDTISLIKQTDGYNGADLEAVVKDAIESAFINGASKITTEDLIESIKDTKSISKTLKDKIDQIRQTISKIDIKQASNSSK